MATTFTFPATVTMTGVATTAGSNLLTVAASSAGSWGVVIGATLSHANIPAGTTITGYNSSIQAVMSQNASITGSALTVTATNPPTINIDDVAGVLKTGGDIYNISGPTFVIDQDSRFGLNQINTSATAASTLGSMVISATLGGAIDIDSRYVRLIPFDTGSGTITAGATITCDSATGEVIGIYSALNTAPVLTGVAAGWIKVKNWNTASFPTSGTFTQAGYTFNITGPDVPGFIVVQGDEASTITANRLGLFRMRGTYYELGTTSGARTQTFQVPFNGGAVDISCVEVETSPGGGTYEPYVCANTVTATATTMATDWRGKVFWLNRTTGVLRFGHDGTNQTGGYLPTAGCLVRMYNLITANNTAAARQTIAVPNATLATRYDFTTTGGGVLSFDKVNLAWYPSFSQAYQVDMTNTAVCDAMVISENATAWTPSNLVVSPAPTTTVQAALSATAMPAGITFTDCNFVRLSMASAGNYTCTVGDTGDVVLNRTHSIGLVYQGNAGTGGWNVYRAKSWTQNAGCIGQRSVIGTMSNVKIYSPIFYDHPATASSSSLGRSAISLNTVTDFLIDGWDNGGLSNCQPYASLVDLGSGCARGVIQNFGTYVTPLSLGGPTLAHGLTWTRATTTATVTHTAHGLITGNAVNVVITSDAAAIVLGQKSVTVTGVDTYTFACLNAGAASGTISARQAITGLPVTASAGAANVDIAIRRIYFVGGRGSALAVADNSNSRYTLRNIYDMDLFNAGAFPMLNSTVQGTGFVGTTTGVSGQYGTHWYDYYIYNQTPLLDSLPYTRATTVATVTMENHSLYTGAIVNVTVRSDTATMGLGPKTVTVKSNDTFEFAVTNSGAASGYISIQTPNARLQVAFNEPTAATSSYVTVLSGAANFTSAGTCLLPSIGDSIEIAGQGYLKGYSGITQNVPAMVGGTLNNFTCTYDIDTGAGYSGTFKNLSRPQVVSGSTGQFTLAVEDSSVILVGDAVYGTSIAGLAKVATIDSPTQVTLNLAHTGNIVSALCQFSSVCNESIDPNIGFKMKWRFTRRAAGVDAITFLYIWMSATGADRQIQYPDPGVPLTLTGLVPGSDVVVLQAGSSNVLDSVDSNGTSSWSYNYTTLQNVDIGILKPGYVPLYIRDYALSGAAASFPIAQSIDRNYS